MKGLGALKTLPPEIAYLAKPAIKYGRYQFDDDIANFLTSASKEEFDELKRIADKCKRGGHYVIVNKWLDEHNITQYEEAARLYFLFGVLDAAGIEFE